MRQLKTGPQTLEFCHFVEGKHKGNIYFVLQWQNLPNKKNFAGVAHRWFFPTAVHLYGSFLRFGVFLEFSVFWRCPFETVKNMSINVHIFVILWRENIRKTSILFCGGKIYFDMFMPLRQVYLSGVLPIIKKKYD